MRYEDLTAPLVAIIGAGGSYAPDDPLLKYAGVRQKALIPIAGRPMILHVAHALADSGCISHLIVVGLEQEHGLEFPLPITLVPEAGGIVENFLQGGSALASIAPRAERAVLCSTDIPLITGGMVRYLVDTTLSTDADVCYTIIRREVMEARFPNSGRSYVALRDGKYAGGDVHLINPELFYRHEQLLEELVGARKNALKQARTIGLGFLLKFIVRRLALIDGERKAEGILGVPCRAIPVRYAELGMDVDKPYQLDLARTVMEARSDDNPKGALPRL